LSVISAALLAAFFGPAHAEAQAVNTIATFIKKQ
jgi:hypothetical protein